MIDLSVFTAFGAGLLTFFSPCVLPLIAVYISLITGFSLDDLKNKEKVHLINVLPKIIAFILGFSLVFILLGILAGYLGSFILINKRFINIFGGAVVVFLGLYILGVIKFDFLKFLNREFRFHKHGVKPSTIGAFLTGLFFAAGWTPCVGPILGGILTMAAAKQEIGKSFILLSFYSLGLAVPFFIFGVFINVFLDKLKFINKFLIVFSKVAGICLILIGVFLMFGKFL
ncbi:cytochrome c biogenesis CcdA family protein [bacterium]